MFNVGDRVRTNAEWNPNYFSEGIVSKVDGNSFYFYWPQGLIYVAATLGDDLFRPSGYDESEFGDGWTLTGVKNNLELIGTAPRGILPGDRVRVIEGAFKDCEGTMTYSVDRFKRPVVLITDDPVGRGFNDDDEGRSVGFHIDSLSLIEPVETGTDQHHEAIDTILPFV